MESKPVLLGKLEAAGLLGISLSSFNRHYADNPPFGFVRIGNVRKYLKDEISNFIAAQCAESRDKWARKFAGSGGIHSIPDRLAEKEYAAALRIVAVTGVEPDGILQHWRTARFHPGSPPADILSAFELAATASWAYAVGRAQDLLALSAHAKPIELKRIADRLSAFRGSEIDEALS